MQLTPLGTRSLTLVANRGATSLAPVLATLTPEVIAARDAAAGSASNAATSATNAATSATNAASAADTAVTARLGVFLPASNGTDDTAAINNILATSGGKAVHGRVGQTYKVTGPLVLPPGGKIVLDMTGCVIQMQDTVVKNILNNAAITPLRTVTDAAMTSGSTTLTSATAAFVSADVDRWVRIAGAAVSGDLLVARVVSVTNATTVVLDTAASTTVSAATLNIHAADSDITIIGGTWDHGRNGRGNVQTPDDFAIRLRYIDRLEVRDMTHTSTWGKYAVAIGAVTDYRIVNHTFDNFYADGIHIAGPARRGVVRDCRGGTGDDMVAITSQEPTGWEYYNDTLGLVEYLTVENVQKKSGSARVFHVVPGRSAPVRNITARNISGVGTSYGVYVWGDSAKPGGRLDNFVLENVATTSTTGSDTVMFHQLVGDNITVRNVRRTDDNANRAVMFLDCTLGMVTVDGIQYDHSAASMDGPALYVGGASSIDCLNVSRLNMTVSTTQTVHPIQVLNSSSIKRMSVRDSQYVMNGAYFCYLVRSQTTGTIGHLTIDGVRYKSPANLGGVVETTTNSLTALAMSNCLIDGGNQAFGQFAGTTLITAQGVRYTGTGNLCSVTATGAVTLDGIAEASSTGVAITAGGTVRVKSSGVRLDVGLINNKTTGDVAFNLNASRSCGVGPAMWNGTAWVNLATGATF